MQSVVVAASLRSRPSTPSSLHRSNFSSSHHRHFSSSTARQAKDENHYDVLGLSKSATKREIKDKFYEVSFLFLFLPTKCIPRFKAHDRVPKPKLSRTYHPDAPSTSSSDSQESRTKHFQSLSQSYSVLSDETLRKQYDASLSGRGTYGGRPTYSTAGREQSGFGGGSAAAWSASTTNEKRRSSANYAWAHPSSRTASAGASASQTASQRSNPFRRGDYGGPSENHFETFQARENRARERAQERNGGFSATAGFGAKAAVCSSPSSLSMSLWWIAKLDPVWM